jgi:hypothetical protein
VVEFHRIHGTIRLGTAQRSRVPVRGLLNIHFVGELLQGTGGVSVGELLRDLDHQSGGFEYSFCRRTNRWCVYRRAAERSRVPVSGL